MLLQAINKPRSSEIESSSSVGGLKFNIGKQRQIKLSERRASQSVCYSQLAYESWLMMNMGIAWWDIGTCHGQWALILTILPLACPPPPNEFPKKRCQKQTDPPTHGGLFLGFGQWQAMRKIIHGQICYCINNPDW
jgi:hypothetical protein